MGLRIPRSAALVPAAAGAVDVGVVVAAPVDAGDAVLARVGLGMSVSLVGAETC